MSFALILALLLIFCVAHDKAIFISKSPLPLLTGISIYPLHLTAISFHITTLGAYSLRSNPTPPLLSCVVLGSLNNISEPLPCSLWCVALLL